MAVQRQDLIELARKGRAGADGVRDTILAHISPREVRLLEAAGGSGTINPETGLREFKYGADTNEGGAHGYSGGSNGNTENGDGPTITHGPAPAPGPNETVTQGFTHTKQSPHGGEVKGWNADGTMNVGPTAPEKKQQDDITGAWNAYNNRSFLHEFLDMAAGPLYNENMPNMDDPRTYWGGTYHTSTDPLASAAMLAGLATGLPAGALVQGAEALTGFHPEVYHNPPPSPDYGHTQYGMPADPNATGGTPLGAGDGFMNTGGGLGGQGLNGILSQLPSAPKPAPAATTPAAPTRRDGLRITGSNTVAWPWN